MKFRFIIYSLIVLFAWSCSFDPCKEEDNIECDSGDADKDGILNFEDIAPKDPCLPEMENVKCPTGDIDNDGVVNGVDSHPTDPCLPNDNLACLAGDIDNDGTSNGEDIAPEDPCLPYGSIACPTGDLDNDGIENNEDSHPLDQCLPVIPPFVNVVIGRWEWSTSGFDGILIINQDGTYMDIKNEIIESEAGSEKIWQLNGEEGIELEVLNEFTLYLELKSYDCDQVIFEGFLSDFIFNRL